LNVHEIMSASCDGTVAIIDLRSTGSEATKLTIQTNIPVWSICWSAYNDFEFIAGTEKGALITYDPRMTKMDSSG
jgi:WD40 repeat protein